MQSQSIIRFFITLSACCVIGYVVVDIATRFFSSSSSTETPLTSKTTEEIVPAEMLVDLEKLSLRRVHIPYTSVTFYAWDDSMIQWIFQGGGSEHKIMATLVSLFSSFGGAFLDIGANTGIYSLLAASMGHDAFLFDLQPRCHSYQQAVALVNRLEERMHLMPYALGRDDKQRLRVSPNTGCDGGLRASTASSFVAHTKAVDPASFYEVTTRRLDALVDNETTILVAKIDVEGCEAEVLKGMTQLLKARRIKHILMECSPIIWREFYLNRAYIAEDLIVLWDYGFTDVTFLRNKKESGADIHFDNRTHLFETLRDYPFNQNDFYFRLV